jgi:hypothetical protein
MSFIVNLLVSFVTACSRLDMKESAIGGISPPMQSVPQQVEIFSRELRQFHDIGIKNAQQLRDVLRRMDHVGTWFRELVWNEMQVLSGRRASSDAVSVEH